jgi:hypothetical protein
MRFLLIILSAFILSCYPKIQIEGFEPEAWNKPFETCEDSKEALANLIISQQEKLLGEGQAEIKQLLGQPSEHELYRRNQKFFFYFLTPGDTCENVISHTKLSIKFDAIDRAKELMIELVDN